MNHNEHPSDSVLAAELRGSLANLTVAARPPVEAIASRGRARRRRRVAGLTGLGLSGALAGTALALGLAGVLGAAPAPGAGTIQTDAFTLTGNPNGTDTLTISRKTLWDPARLRRALAAHHIPALVETGFVNCQSAPVPNRDAMTATTSHGQLVLIINPAAIPAGAELYFSEGVNFIYRRLIWTHAHTCH
jgi:hypothetical protein